MIVCMLVGIFFLLYALAHNGKPAEPIFLVGAGIMAGFSIVCDLLYKIAKKS